MTASEVLVRGRQEASKWLDRLPLVNGRGVQTARRRPQQARIIPTRFFEGVVCADTTAKAIAQMPEYRTKILAAADTVSRGRFDLLGYRGLDFGDPVDWSLDPLSGRRAPHVHWSRLRPLDRSVVGDAKVVWELNRHQWLLHLGQAYRLTGDEQYAEASGRYVEAWLRANPPGIGINWASSLEVAFRLISWCWTLALVEGSRGISAQLRSRLLDGIVAHARHVERYLSHYFSPNTHLTGEALGLVYAGALFPELRRARRWQVLGTRTLITQCERQILADGVYFEQSTCYQRYTAEIYLHFLILAARHGIDVPDAVAERLQRVLDFLAAVRQPHGSMPQIGDADGGWLLPLLPRAPDDLRGVFSVAAAFFRRSDYASVAGGVTPEALWLLGPAATDVFRARTPAPRQTSPSQIFPHGGYAVMRSGWEWDAHQLVFDVGPLGCLARAGHGHADLLSIQCSVFGEPYLIDPGTYCYAAQPEWQDHFRSTAAHSTVRVDGQEQAVPAGRFKWGSRPGARLRQWRSTTAFDFADGEHDAYARLPDPVTHRRRVVFVKPRYWVIVDDVSGTDDHHVEIGFQFAPMEVTLQPDFWARARGAGGCSLLVRPFARVGLQATICRGEVDPIRGWASTHYGQRMAAPLLVYATRVRLPFRIVTLLLPLRDPLAIPPAVSPERADGAGPLGLRFVDSGERIQFDQHGPVISIP